MPFYDSDTGMVFIVGKVSTEVLTQEWEYDYFIVQHLNIYTFNCILALQ